MKTLLQVSFILLLLASCQIMTQAPTAAPTETVLPTQMISPQTQARQNEITSIWENSSHAQVSNPVNCSNCHQIENGIVLEDVLWHNQQTGQYEAVSEANSLCGHCHEETSAGSAHLKFTCIDCHDTHKVNVSCTDSGCHSNIPTVFYDLPATPTGGHPTSGSSFCGSSNCHSVATAVAETAGSIHGPEHVHVTCSACHYGSQLQVGPSPDDGTWIILHEVDVNGENLSESHFSHTIQLKVDCARCHFENNPWGLNLVTGQKFEK